MIVFPNAKINLGLRITARRPDGYHDIESLMVPVGWRDILEVVPGKSTTHTLTVSGQAIDCPPEANLVMKALRALEGSLSSPLPPLDIFLRKIIPDGAGLGGGSSDAASLLTAVNTHLSLGLSAEELASTAARIGADCPFFIYNNVAEATGTGTTLIDASAAKDALRSLRLTIAIAKPPEGVSTREAYAGVAPRPLEGPTPAEIVATLPPSQWEDAGLVNDFEPSIFARCPSVKRAKEVMRAAGAVYCAMSGSGSAVFGLFAEGSDNMSDVLAEELPDCSRFVAPLLPD